MPLTLKWPAGHTLPVIGQGTWRMGEYPGRRAAEVAALQQGITLGMTVIDTAEMYGEGGAERIVGEALQGRRDDVFLVSKVYPHHASHRDMIAACERSLKRMRTDSMELYLLHWASSTPMDEILEGFTRLKAAGKIQQYGVSNFNLREMQALWARPRGAQCCTNQVLYHLGSRGIEFDLLPAMIARKLPIMAYCPTARGGQLGQEVTTHPTVVRLAHELEITPIQLLLAWAVRPWQGQRYVMAIPKAVQPAHVEENARALHITLPEQAYTLLDNAFPPPQQREPLDIL